MAYRTAVTLFLLALLSTGAALAGGSIFSANGVGEQQVGGGIRTLGLAGGGFGLQDTMGFSSLNPALAAFIPRTIMRMSGEVGFWNTTANGETDSDGEMTWRDLRLYLPITNRWKLGAGIEPTRRQDLHTIAIQSAQFANDTTVRQYEERVTWSGGTVDFKLDNAFRVSDRLGLGVGIIYSVLHNQQSTEVNFPNTDYQSPRFDNVGTFRGWSFSVGGYYEVSERLGAGAYFRPRSSGNRTYTQSKSGTDSTIKGTSHEDSPGEFGAGISYKLSNSFTGVADAWGGQWSSGDYGIVSKLNGNAPQNPLFLSIGVERIARHAPLYTGLDLWSYRAGLFYRRHYWSTTTGDPVTDLGLSVGNSIPIAKSSGWLHWAGEVGKRGMDEKKIGATETFFRISFQFEIGETWFQRTKPRVPQG